MELESGTGFSRIDVSSADREGRWTTLLQEAKKRGVRVLATSSHKGTPISDADLRGPVVLMVGNEGAGLPKEVLAHADEIVAIPQSPKVESLNAGIAASIVLYEAARQRNSSPPRHKG